MKRTILLAAVAVACASCGKPKLTTSDFVNPDDGSGQKPVNETDTSACSFGRKPDSLDGGRWQIFLRSGDIRFTTVFEFSNRRLWVSNTCRFPNHTVTAYVNSPVSENSPGVLLIENTTEKTEKTTDASGRLTTCTASLKRTSVNYSFKGSCLQLQVPGSSDVTTLVPVY